VAQVVLGFIDWSTWVERSVLASHVESQVAPSHELMLPIVKFPALLFANAVAIHVIFSAAIHAFLLSSEFILCAATASFQLFSVATRQTAYESQTFFASP